MVIDPHLLTLLWRTAFHPGPPFLSFSESPTSGCRPALVVEVKTLRCGPPPPSFLLEFRWDSVSFLVLFSLQAPAVTKKKLERWARSLFFLLFPPLVPSVAALRTETVLNIPPFEKIIRALAPQILQIPFQLPRIGKSYSFPIIVFFSNSAHG